MKEQIKPELNNESKAKLFAQYWGQKVWIVLMNGDSFIQKVCASYMTKYSLKYRALLLTSLSNISDEDAIEVAKIALYSPEIEDWSSDEVWIGEGDLDNRGNHSLEVGMRCWTGLLKINDLSGSITLHDEEGEMQEIHNLTAIIDYLRSKGYALPWMGYSVEDLVNAGWVKLKGANNNG